jgi:hypothetical protein
MTRQAGREIGSLRVVGLREIQNDWDGIEQAAHSVVHVHVHVTRVRARRTG